MKGTLVKWFVSWAVAMIVGMVLFSAFGPTAKEISLDEINFKTTESSALYFKNIRSYFYDLEEEKKSGFKIYRLSSRPATAKNKLHFMILHNWRMNEAYIMAESEQIDKGKASMRLLIGQSNDTISLDGADAEANFRFAAQLFTAMEKEESVSLLSNDEAYSFEQSELKSIKKCLKDYFKLVGKLR